MPGVGKTAFAVHAAHLLSPGFPDGQIFLSLRGHVLGQRPVDPSDALASLLQTAGVAIQQIPRGLEARARLWRDHLANKNILLLLDDAIGHEQVRPLLPGTPGSLVLITSRMHLTALEDAQAIDLNTLLPSEAAALLVQLADRADVTSADNAVAEITRLCGYLPLAIGMLARQLHHRGAWTTASLARELAETRDQLGLFMTENISVAAAFDLSYRELTAAQQRLFRRLGLHPGTDIDSYAAAALDADEPTAAHRCLDVLCDHYLLAEPTRGRYRLHDLMRAHAQTLVSRDQLEGREAACDRLLDYYLRTACAADSYLTRRTPSEILTVPAESQAKCPAFSSRESADAWMDAERLNLHAVVNYAVAGDRLAYAAAIPAAMHGFLRSHHYWDQALTLHEIALSAARQRGDRRAEARALIDLADVQYLTDDYASAVAGLTQALQLCRSSGDQLGEANALSDLGFMQRLSGDYRAADADLVRALELWRELDIPLGEAWALTEHGLMQSEVGDYNAAAQCLVRALELYHNAGDKLGEARALNYLGSVQRLMGEYSAAADTLDEALRLHHNLGYQLGEARAYKDIGELRAAMENFPAAIANLTRALDIYDEIRYRLGEARALNSLGVAQRLSGDYAAAAESFAKALELSRTRHYRPGEAEALNGMGELSLAYGNSDDAEGRHRQALQIAAEIAFVPEQARALAGIGRCHLHEGHLDEGRAFLRQALELYQRIGSPMAKRIRTELGKW
jgi:tetratricopeptide (TPR) repeat protein